MQEVVNEEFFEELAADYEFKSKSIKKWWNMLTSSFDFIQNDDMGACCLSRVADYRSQSNDASKNKYSGYKMSSDEHSRTISFECTLLKKDILRAVKETYPMYFDQPIEIENEGEMVLVYSPEDNNAF